jgi:hypothetical protein
VAIAMIDCIFSLDYEIYGNGTGSLDELVIQPAERLRTLFRQAKARFVVFPEVAELEMIEAAGSDAGISAVKDQLRRLRSEGFEVGLHLHPWWYNARYSAQAWQLDYSEYNMCDLPPRRIEQMIDRSFAYLRGCLRDAAFTPLAFRAGHLLFQPSAPAARVLASRGIRLDSSVYKGGVWRQHRLDYRRANRNGYWWRFSTDSARSEPDGDLLEIPIHTEMVRTWKLITQKRMRLEQKAVSTGRSRRALVTRLFDLRLDRPLKLDFCSMTAAEMTAMLDRVVAEDRRDPTTYRPIVAIGHTKDLVDFAAVEATLDYLRSRNIRIATFADAYALCPAKKEAEVVAS